MTLDTWHMTHDTGMVTIVDVVMVTCMVTVMITDIIIDILTGNVYRYR